MDLLLIEDDPITSEVLSLLLAEDGWQIVTAESGEAALAHLRHTATLPAIVVCDQKLPGVSGPPLAESIRAAYRQADISTVVLLAMSASHGPVPVGYDALLLKPFAASEVRTAFENVQGGPHGNDVRSHSVTTDTEELRGLPILDADTFEKLETSMGTARLRELYRFAMDDATARVSRMQASMARADQHELTKEAHMLKGAAGMVGARRLAALAQFFETPMLADSGTSGLSGTKMAMLTTALDDIEHMLKTLFPAQA